MSVRFVVVRKGKIVEVFCDGMAVVRVVAKSNMVVVLVLIYDGSKVVAVRSLATVAVRVVKSNLVSVVMAVADSVVLVVIAGTPVVASISEILCELVVIVMGVTV